MGRNPANEDLGVWQSHMAWEYGTDWVAGFLAGRRRYVEGPQPAPVGLWPIAHLRHHESDESGREEDGGRRTTGAARTQGVTAPSGPVIAPPSIAPPVVATAVPTIPAGTTAETPTIPTTTVAPTPVAKASSTVPATQPAAGGVSTTTTTGAQLPRERPPTTKERHPKRAATEAAATLLRTAARGWGGTKRPSRNRGGRRVAGRPAVGASPGRGQMAVGDGPATPRGSSNKNHLHGLQGGCQNGTGRPGSSRRSVTAGQAGAYGVRGRSSSDGAATSRGSGDDRALRAAEGRLSGPGAGLGTGDPQKGSSRNGRRIGIGGTRGSEVGTGGGRQGKSRSDAGRHYAPASDAHPYKWATIGPNGATSDHNGTSGLGGAAGAHFANNGNEAGGSTAPGDKAAHKPVRDCEVQLEGGVQRWDEPQRRHHSTPGVLPNQFKEPLEVSAEFSEGYATPPVGAERTIAERFAQRILTDKNLDVGFSLNEEEAGHRLQELWRRMRQEEHERQPPYERLGLRRPPLLDPSTWAVSKEFLDEQGLEPIELEGEALGESLADLEEAVRVWWRTTGPATRLPAH
jgi:hypothetical protein